MGIQQLIEREKRAQQQHEKSLKELAKQLADILYQKELLAGRITEALHKEFTGHFQKELETNFSLIRTRTEEGSFELIQALFEISRQKPHYFLEESCQNLAHLVTTKKEITQALENGKTIQELFELTDQTIKALYAAAKYLYDKKEYQKAADSFGVLTILNPCYQTFWLALGHSEYFLGHFEQALTAYAMASHLHPEDPHPYIFSAQCYEYLNDKMNAVNSLEVAFEAIEDKKEYENLKKQIIKERKRLM